MPATDRIASKAAHQMADILIDNVREVDEVIIGTPQELHRPQSVISVVKVYVRVGEHLSVFLRACILTPRCCHIESSSLGLHMLLVSFPTA